MLSALQRSNMPFLREFYNFCFVFLIVGSYFVERCFEGFVQHYCGASGLEIKLSIMRFKSRNIEKSDDFKSSKLKVAIGIDNLIFIESSVKGRLEFYF